MFFMDWSYIVIVLPAILLSLIAQGMVKSTFSKYSKVSSLRGLTGREAAERVLLMGGAQNVKIERVSGSLTDHYDPRTNVIRLSESVYDKASVAAIGVAAHEAGHAVQYATGYGPIKLRASIITVTNIGSNLALPLILLGIIMSYPPIAYVGVAAFGLSVVFQLITLPVEFNASSRAIAALEGGNLMNDTELSGAKKVLRAAALTYVAALAVSLANLLRLLIIVGSNSRRRN